MKFEKTEVWGFEGALRGMRNPKESWSNSDSHYEDFVKLNENKYPIGKFIIGKNDLKLAQTLIRAGSEHRKFMRQIFVSVDITAPLYWWKEFDTYKVGTVTNSTSTMHKLADTPITRDCFEMGDFEEVGINSISQYVNTTMDWWDYVISACEELRQKYNKTKDRRYWKELIRLLPESWLQTRTITMTYENVLKMIQERKNHKLIEWSESFINWIKSLPYTQDLLFL